MKGLLFLLFGLVLLVACGGFLLPGSTQVERSIVVIQTPERVYEEINSLKNFQTWNPWAEKDPNMEVEYSGPASGVGAKMSWHSEDPNVGTGSQEIVKNIHAERVHLNLDFGAMGFATANFKIQAVGDESDGVRVTWQFNTEHGANLMSRYMGLLMDKWIGAEYELGLANLKAKVESDPYILSREVKYTFEGTELTGFLSYPANASGPLPGVLVVHEWWGHNDYVRTRAKQLAGLGYVAFALDMYGSGKVTGHPKEANAFMMEVVQNFDLLKGRFDAGFAYLSSLNTTAPDKIAAIGYCFGGAVVLNMARSGAPLAGVASFHGGLSPLADITERGKSIPYMVFNGADDPMVTAAQKSAFKDSMDAASVSYEFIEYPGAVHAFTNPGATQKGEAYGLPLAYDAAADKDSWLRLTQFLKELF